ncbi:hypothetical protein ACWCP6_06665 [Streptomyces sp. NPDC002004]
MYLVHVHLASHPRGDILPGRPTVAAIAGCGAGVDGFEHVSVHTEAGPAPVIGMYLRASSLEAAEAAAETLWWRSCTAHPWLYAWEFRRAEVPLLLSESSRRNTE